MAAKLRVSTEDIISVYALTGSVWKTGKQLGICGQSVHERLKKAGVKMTGTTKWEPDELEELTVLYESRVTLSEIASRLNRTYAGVACKLNEIGLKGHQHQSTNRKIPRGAGYDKKSTQAHMKALLADPRLGVTKYARRVGLNVTPLVDALKKHFPVQYEQYLQQYQGDVPTKECLYCGSEFTPSSGRQKFCTRKCASRHSTNLSYFGGVRDTAVGMREGVCQLCTKEYKSDRRQMHAHHVIGKVNDPDNKIMVALCPGCHQLVGMAARNRDLMASPQAWQNFINLAWFEANGHMCVDKVIELGVTVEIEVSEC